MLNVGISFWGFLARHDDHVEVETPDGLRGERAFFVDELLRRGHRPIQLQRRRERAPFYATHIGCELRPGEKDAHGRWKTSKDDMDKLIKHGAESWMDGNGAVFARTLVESSPAGFPHLDVMFVEWRWRIPHKSTEDWDRQCALLDHYSRVGTPIIVHDTDLKITGEDELRWPTMIICDPCIKPRHITRTRVRMPFCNVFDSHRQLDDEPTRYTYVGNNYERQVQFEKYYARPAERLRSHGVQTTVHGNWLTKSPERMHPRAIVQQYPHVAFAPRVAYKDALGTLQGSLATCHITKPEYAYHGNVTVRYFEALAAGVPALVPSESAAICSVGDAAGLTVGSSHDVVVRLKWLLSLSVADRARLVTCQERALRELADFSPAYKVELIEAAAKGVLTT